MGSAINPELRNASDPLYSATYAAEYNLATAENSCKFSPTEPGRGQFSFEECDFIHNQSVALDQGAFRGHNFVWGNYNPDWLTAIK